MTFLSNREKAKIARVLKTGKKCHDKNHNFQIKMSLFLLRLPIRPIQSNYIYSLKGKTRWTRNDPFKGYTYYRNLRGTFVKLLTKIFEYFIRRRNLNINNTLYILHNLFGVIRCNCHDYISHILIEFQLVNTFSEWFKILTEYSNVKFNEAICFPIQVQLRAIFKLFTFENVQFHSSSMAW